LRTKLLLSAFIVFAITLTGCNSNNDEPANGAKLRALVIQALEGNYEANLSLKGMLDNQHIGRKDFNSLRIDSGKVNNKYYYSVLLEYFDPLLNLFAVYDSHLRLYLIDKSLNGNLSVEWSEKGNRNFILVQERFLTKDVLNIDRLSICEVYDTTVGIIYRSLSRLVRDKDTSYQSVENISDNFIVTKMRGSEDPEINNKPDTFYFNINSKKYFSKRNLFNNYVKQEIKDFRWITTKPQIPTEIFNDGSVTDREKYSISLDKEWQKFPGYTEEILLKQSLTGTKFLNKKFNSGIIIMEIPAGKSGEDYSFYNFSKPPSGSYKIRSTSIYTIDKNYNQLIEHSCGDKKYLLLFECPKNIYEQNKKMFDEIINSFFIEC